MFTPFRSCSLYHKCKEQGLLPPGTADDIDYGYAFDENTILRFPDGYKKMLEVIDFVKPGAKKDFTEYNKKKLH